MKAPRQHVGVGGILVTLLFAPGLYGQVLPNPVPLISQPLVPTSVAPGSGSFTMIVNGTGFVPPGFAPGSVVNWNGSPRTTTFISSSQLNADILAADVATVTTAAVAVDNPKIGGGSVRSNIVYFPVANSIASVSLTQTSYLVGSSPADVAVGDFNGDGVPDLATPNANSNSISIRLGVGNGTFTTIPDVTGIAFPDVLATGDFNGDGILDLAAAGSLSTSVTIFLGNGDGTFVALTPMTTNANPSGIAVADLNGDGILDLAIAGQGGSTPTPAVSIFLGNGNGTFQARVDYATQANCRSVAAGDFNGDGVLDLVAGNAGASSVSFLKGNGNGTFQAAVNIPTGSTGPYDVHAADLNGDGFLDFIVAHRNTDLISAFLGNGDGTFQAALNTPTTVGGRPTSLTTADFNGDGILDVAVANQAGNIVVIQLGNGDGTFQAVSTSSVILAPQGIAAVDLDGDGRLDVASASVGGFALYIMLQTPPAPKVQLSTTSVNFGVQLVNTTSAPMQVTLTNSGTATLNFTSFNAQVSTGNTTPSPDFSQNNNCGSSLAVSALCTINALFTPTSAISLSAVIKIASNAPGSPHFISLSGSGLSTGVITPSVPNLDFGSHPVGTVTTQQIVINNTGAGSMNIQGITFTGNFALDAANSTCPNPGPLFPGPAGACMIGIKFSAYTLGANNGQLAITHDAAGSPTLIPLTGTGTAVPFADGEVFASESGGQVRRFSPTGQLIQVLDTNLGGFNAGSAFDRNGNLYVTNFSAGKVSKFDGNGALLGTFGSGYSGSNESIVFDTAGNAYVGSVDGDNDIRKFDSNGTPLAQFDVLVEDRGSDWIELGPDQCTMYYTSEGTAVKRFNVCTNTQLADFATGIGDLSTKFTLALRLRPNGEMLVANWANIVRLNSSGNVIQTYDATGIDDWFALNLDRDGTSFWSASYSGTAVVKFDIASGNELMRFVPGDTAGGLGVKGEIQVATSPAVSVSTASVNFTGNPLNLTCPTKPVTVTNTGNGDLVISSIVADSPFAVASTTCPVGAGALLPNQSCVVNLKFQPATVGTVTGKLLTITSNAPGSPHTVALSGTGTPACALLARVRSVTVLRGTDAQDFAIEDAKPSCSPVNLNLACSVDNPAACLLNPAVIAPSGASTLKVSNLRRVATEALQVTVTSTSEFRQATELVTVRFADFAMTKSPEAATVGAGGTATYALAIRPVNGLAGNLALACSGAPRGARCAVEPSSVALDGTSLAQVKVKVTTRSGAGALPTGGVNLSGWAQSASWRMPLLLGLMALLAVAAVSRRRAFVAPPFRAAFAGLKPGATRLVLAAMILAMLVWASCGGGGGSMNFGSSATPAGNYTLTITGTYSSSSGPTPGTLANSTTLSLKVN